ncbi:MAG: hypothetical protein LC539_16165 [Candidatus Thiodiazotropha sp.]|nr:hypothetical protein [Candidatus Thiodiazotropha sp.]MCM8921053.1 hypothetical protein [Candidatus Thiodiazotropha sp.]
MNSDINNESGLYFFCGQVSTHNWKEIMPGLAVKSLVVDEEKHSVEFIMKVNKSWEPGWHRHLCETSLLVIEGSIFNRGTKNIYSPDDFFYQEYSNTHVEEMGDNGLMAYVSMRGKSDTLVEFFGKNREIRGTMGVSHFS